MQFLPWIMGALGCLPAVTLAQAPASDPASPVPMVLYRSVFADTPKGVETDTLEWKAANAEVGQFARGHIDILKWEAAQRQSETGKPAMPMPMPMPYGSAMEPKKP